jgi:hypothetical protein
MPTLPDIDLSAIPEGQRDAVAALLQEASSLKAIIKRLEHLVAELNYVVHGKKSEKLDEDDRQLAFEDLNIAISEAEEQKQDQAPSDDTSKRKRVAKRNRGNLPKDLPRIERVIEPDSLECPCGCGVAIVARTNGATMTTAQDWRRSHRAAGHRACTAAGDRHRASQIRVPIL